jgi:hypothetical protein
VAAPALPAGWTSSATGAAPAWVTSNGSSDTAPNNAFAFDVASVGNTELFSPLFAIRTGAGSFSFRNNYNTEATFDGMVLEISVNGGPYKDIIAAGGSFVTGGYNGTISTGFSSPIAGRQAWTGSSAGYITTTVNLPASASGQNVRLKWRMASDSSVAGVGVRVDTITGIPCSAQPLSRSGFDYDGDRRSDISVYRPGPGAWYLFQSTQGLAGVQFGISTDKIAPADYDGDGRTDVAVYRPSLGIWFIIYSGDASVQYSVFGVAEDLPVPADYDGDGRADLAVFRPSSGTWYWVNSSTGQASGRQFGAFGDKPTVGDFDGDGRADLAVFRPPTGAWYQINSATNTLSGEGFGFSTDVICPADFDGDGRTDIAVYRPSNGFWYIRRSATNVYTAFPFGAANDIPAPADFDGDGAADLNVFRPGDGNWYRINSSDGLPAAFNFGANGDKPTHTAFRY